MLTYFVTHLNDNIINLKHLIDKKKHEEIHELAHSIKNDALQLGLNKLGRLLEFIEINNTRITSDIYPTLDNDVTNTLIIIKKNFDI
jgi:HPt (histidine-containing phosphotransfer) domain-containing protein